MNGMPECLSSFGVEIEFNLPSQSAVSRVLRELRVSAHVTYDVSAQENIAREAYTGTPIIGDIDHLVKESETFGGEIVSDIWNFGHKDYALTQLNMILKSLESLGETGISHSAGVHVHVMFPKMLYALKNLVLIAARMEKFLFSIGGMGYRHRCVGSDAVYYRPITGPGPLVVPTQTGWAQAFSVESLLKSKSLEEFFQRYGDCLGSGGAGRYPPVRYHFLNLINLVKERQTAELRVFNTTLDPVKIWSVAKLFQQMCKTAVMNSHEWVLENFGEGGSVFSTDEVDLLEEWEYFSSRLCLDDSLAQSTIETLSRISEVVTLPDRMVRSHLHDRHPVTVFWKGLATIPQPQVPEEKINHPVYMDSYVLGGLNPQTRFSSMESLRGNSVTTSVNDSPDFGIVYEFPTRAHRLRLRTQRREPEEGVVEQSTPVIAYRIEPTWLSPSNEVEDGVDFGGDDDDDDMF